MLLYQDFQDSVKDGGIIISQMMKKDAILSAVKSNDNGEPILNENGKTISDAVSTLIFTIANHFIGDPSLWKDRSAELLSNLKCKSLSNFKWYKDTFLTRVFTREDSQQSFWKEKFLAGLPKFLGDKIEEQINNHLLESSKEELEHEFSEDLNNIQHDDNISSSSDEYFELNDITQEQYLLFNAINAISDPEQRKYFLQKLK
ncbi:uncharacterized protein DS421_14g471910 [Arachis hypogaea]|nr:uncharacterized protein DS421_14g471910 [Arachis hypogaea]